MLLSVSIELSAGLTSFNQRFKNAPSLAQSVEAEISSIRDIFVVLNRLIIPTVAQPSRSSLISVQHVLVSLTEAVRLFDELEAELDPLIGIHDFGLMARTQWTWKESRVTKLVNRLQWCKGTLSLQLNILQWLVLQTRSSLKRCLLVGVGVGSDSLLEAQRSREALDERVQARLAYPDDLARRVDVADEALAQHAICAISTDAKTEAGTVDHEQRPDEGAGPEAYTTSRPTSTQVPLRDFEESLMKSWVYRRGRDREEDMSFETFTLKTTAPSVLSQITLSQMSIVSVIALPLCIAELRNGGRYDGSSQDDSIGEPNNEEDAGRTLAPGPVLLRLRMPADSRVSYQRQSNATGFWMADLPSVLERVVAAMEFNTILLLFPLDFKSIPLGYGVRDISTLTLHLHLSPDGQVDKFCVYIHRSTVSSALAYERTRFRGPDYCTKPGFGLGSGEDQFDGRSLRRVTHLITQDICQRLVEGQESLSILYEGIRGFSSTMLRRCMACGEHIGSYLHRPALCSEPRCMEVYLDTNLAFCEKEIQNDRDVMGLLLTTVHAATLREELLDLLPSLLPDFRDISKLTRLLATLTPESQLRFSGNPNHPLEDRLGTELLLAWTYIGYRGFLVSVSSQYKIIPNVHQFLLVDAPPEVEARFIQRDITEIQMDISRPTSGKSLFPDLDVADFTSSRTQQWRVMFHGTTMDRLYSILTQGLQVLSDTPLMQNSAPLGPGIYFAKEPARALLYGSGRYSTHSESSSFRSSGYFKNQKVLLGCELARNALDDSSSGDGEFVVRDPSLVVVRYIFLFPPGAKVPSAQTVVPAMLKVFDNLRSMRARHHLSYDLLRRRLSSRGVDQHSM